MTKCDSLQVHKDGSTYGNQYDTPHKQKPHDHLARCRKSIEQDSTSIHDKNSYQSGYRGIIPQYNKSYL